MKNIYNILNSILLSLSIFLFIAAFSFVNKRFVYNVIDEIKYEDIAYDNIVKEIEEYDSSLKYKLDKKDIRSDLNNYLNHGFQVPNLKSKIIMKGNNKDIDNIYISNIKFLDSISIIKIKNIIYICSIIVIFITGNLFNKFKHKLKIEYILLLSGVINIFIYGLLYLFNNFSGVIETLLYKSLHIYLFVACLEIAVSIILYNDKKIDKLFKRKNI